MNKFTTGFIAGGILAAAGAGYLLSDENYKRKMMRSGRKMAERATDLVDEMKEDIWK